MKQKKFYVVWVGRKIGIFSNWEECDKQVHGFPNAKYKSFQDRHSAEVAFKDDTVKNIIGSSKIFAKNGNLPTSNIPVFESISVDGAWNTATGDAEYQGVCTKTKNILFKQGPYEDGTNNIAEFLAVVHGLVHCKSNKSNIPIYSDSKTAIVWVRNKKVRTSLIRTNRNNQLFLQLERATRWLNNNSYENPILKWETKSWGENPADFGRK